MALCNVNTIKLIGKYLNVPVGNVCFNSDKVLTTVLNKQNVEGFATIILKLSELSKIQMSVEQRLLSYQWLEYISMYMDQSVFNSTLAKTMLQDFNKALEINSYLTGQFMTVADVTVYYVLYSLLDRLSVSERESYLHLCRWFKHIQAQPHVCTSKAPIQLNTLTLSILAPAVH